MTCMCQLGNLVAAVKQSERVSVSPVHNNAAVRKKGGAPTTQEVQRGGVLGQ